MGVSRQTLYRDLKAEGVTFEQVLDDLRHRLELHYLRNNRSQCMRRPIRRLFRSRGVLAGVQAMDRNDATLGAAVRRQG